jgi:hypothetical protein
MYRKTLVAAAALGMMLAQTAFADVRHVVAFRFKAGVDAAAIADYAREFFSLKQRALKDGKPYIVDIVGGRPISKEGYDQNFQQAFIVTFKSAADRDFFVGPPYRERMDPVHEALAKKLLPLLATDAMGKPTGIFVFDFDDSNRG